MVENRVGGGSIAKWLTCPIENELNSNELRKYRVIIEGNMRAHKDYCIIFKHCLASQLTLQHSLTSSLKSEACDTRFTTPPTRPQKALNNRSKRNTKYSVIYCDNDIIVTL